MGTSNKLKSVNIQATCSMHGVVPSEDVFEVGGLKFCGKCLASHLKRSVSTVSMERTEHEFEAKVNLMGACVWCACLRPMTREACPHCGRQPGCEDEAP
jgi:hypothetical protein